MPQGRLFQQQQRAQSTPSLGMGGTTTGPVGSCASPSDVLQRINSLRQSLGHVVASHKESVDCNRRTNLHPVHDSCGEEEGTFMLLLTSSQRRMRDLLNENHKLELLCVKQENIIREIQFEMSMNKQQHAAVATGCDLRRTDADMDVAGELNAGRRGRSTPLRACRVSARGKTRVAPRNDELDTLESFNGNCRSPSLTVEVDDAVQRLVSTSVALFPELETCVRSASRSDGNSWNATLEILYFIESHLEEWSDKKSQKNFDVGDVGNTVSRVLACLCVEQQAWYESLCDIAARLEVAWKKQSCVLRRKNAVICKLERDVKSLTAELTGAAEVRMQWERRCEELEGALSRLEERNDNDDKKMRGTNTANEGNAERGGSSHDPAFSGQQRVTTAAKPEPTEEDANEVDQHVTHGQILSEIKGEAVNSEVEMLRDSVNFLTQERAELRLQLNSANDALRRAEARARVVEAECEALRVELEESRRRSSSSSSSVASAANITAVEEAMPATRGESAGVLCQQLLARDFQMEDSGHSMDYVPDAGLVAVIRDPGADILSEKEGGALRGSGPLFNVGCAIVHDLKPFNDLPEADASLLAWKRLLLHIQHGFGDMPFHSAERAADSLQFFYGLLCLSGMLECMTPVEIIAAVTSALCATYRYVAPIEGLNSPIAEGGGCLSIYPSPSEFIASECSCSYETVCKLMERRHFDFTAHWEVRDRSLLLQTMRILLVPEGSLSCVEHLIHSGAIEVACSAPGMLTKPPLRHQFTRLFIALARHAFTMRNPAASRYWASEKFHLHRRGAHIVGPHAANDADDTSNVRIIAGMQLLLINTTVLPLCQIAARAFPTLQSCLVALQGNLQMWASLNSHDDGAVLPDVNKAYEEVPTSQPLEEKHQIRAVNFKVFSPDDAKRGEVVVDTDGFILTQEEVAALYRENALLREALQKLLDETDAAQEVHEGDHDKLRPIVRNRVEDEDVGTEESI